MEKLESGGGIENISAKRKIIRNFKGIGVIFIYQQDFKIDLNLVGLESNKSIHIIGLNSNKKNPKPRVDENPFFRLVMCDYDRKISEKCSREGN